MQKMSSCAKPIAYKGTKKKNSELTNYFLHFDKGNQVNCEGNNLFFILVQNMYVTVKQFILHFKAILAEKSKIC